MSMCKSPCAKSQTSLGIYPGVVQLGHGISIFSFYSSCIGLHPHWPWLGFFSSLLAGICYHLLAFVIIRFLVHDHSSSSEMNSQRSWKLFRPWNFICVHVSPACVYVYHLCEVPVEGRRGHWFHSQYGCHWYVKCVSAVWVFWWSLGSHI